MTMGLDCQVVSNYSVYPWSLTGSMESEGTRLNALYTCLFDGKRVKQQLGLLQ
jgi:hypothetical protein